MYFSYTVQNDCTCSIQDTVISHFSCATPMVLAKYQCDGFRFTLALMTGTKILATTRPKIRGSTGRTGDGSMPKCYRNPTYTWAIANINMVRRGL